MYACIHKNTHTHTHFSCIHIVYAHGSTQWYLIRICPHLLYIYISIMYPFSSQPFPRSTGGYIWSRPYQFTVFASVKLKLHRTRIEKASRICCLAKRRKTGRIGMHNGGREVGSRSQGWSKISSFHLQAFGTWFFFLVPIKNSSLVLMTCPCCICFFYHK